MWWCAGADVTGDLGRGVGGEPRERLADQGPRVGAELERRGPVGGQDRAVAGDEERRLGEQIDDLAMRFDGHVRPPQLLKYSRPAAASASAVGFRWTTTRQPGAPSAMVSSRTTLA